MAGESVLPPRRGRNPVRPVRVEGEIVYIPLTRGFETIVDVADLHVVEGRNWHVSVLSHGHAYAMTSGTDGGKPAAFPMHRVLMNAPKGTDVDHINGDGLDNRRSNLRIATHRQNMANQVVSRRNKLGMKGAYYHKSHKKFTACIKVDGGRSVHLGHYETPEEAAAAYRGASLVVHGKFANGA